MRLCYDCFYYTLSDCLQSIQRTRHSQPAFFNDMAIDHRGRNIRLPEQLLYQTDVLTAL